MLCEPNEMNLRSCARIYVVAWLLCPALSELYCAPCCQSNIVDAVSSEAVGSNMGRQSVRSLCSLPKRYGRQWRQRPSAVANDGHRRRKAVQDLRAFLSLKFAGGEYPASDIVKLSYYMSEAGIPEMSDLAMNPADSENLRKHAARKVSCVTGMDVIENRFLKVLVPMANAHQGGRVRKEMRANLLADVLMQEFQRAPEEIIEFAASLRIPNWLEHSIRQAHPNDLCLPYGLFVDAAAWKGKGAGTRDSVLAWFCNVLSQKSRR